FGAGPGGQDGRPGLRAGQGQGPRGGAGGLPPGGAPQGGPNGLPSRLPGGGRVPGGAERGGPGGMGGLLDGARVGAEAKTLLKADADHYTWAAAAIGAQNAASYQLATAKPVMAIGGFNGSDPSPTLARFKSYVAEGRIHYFVAGGGGMGGRGGPGGEAGGSAITTWVEASFKKVTVGTATFYDLTAPAR
ncbi:glycosyl transferase, partial [Streptomyces sp. YS-3]